MEFLKKYGIDVITMADLQRTDVYSKLLVMLLDVFNQILITSPDIDINSIACPKDRDLVLHGVYPEYWQNLPRQRKSEQIKKFISLSGINFLKVQLSEKIKDKWNQLMSQDIITTYQDGQLCIVPDKITTFKNEPIISESIESGQNNTTIKGYSRSCLITGLNISMQKESSHFLSISGLKELKQNDLPKFEEIRGRFLPRSGVSGKRTKYELDEFSHIAKQIRSTFSNQHRYKNMIPIEQLSFFQD